jgi:hypothetical protein
MKLYDRSEEKRLLTQKDLEDTEPTPWWGYLFDDEPPWYDRTPRTMNDVRKGFLFTLLVKLGLKSPNEKIPELKW